MCESMKPGTIIMPCASTTRVSAEARFRISALDPTADDAIDRDGETVGPRTPRVSRPDSGVDDDERRGERWRGAHRLFLPRARPIAQRERRPRSVRPTEVALPSRGARLVTRRSLPTVPLASINS